MRGLCLHGKGVKISELAFLQPFVRPFRPAAARAGPLPSHPCTCSPPATTYVVAGPCGNAAQCETRALDPTGRPQSSERRFSGALAGGRAGSGARALRTWILQEQGCRATQVIHWVCLQPCASTAGWLGHVQRPQEAARAPCTGRGRGAWPIFGARGGHTIVIMHKIDTVVRSLTPAWR